MILRSYYACSFAYARSYGYSIAHSKISNFYYSDSLLIKSFTNISTQPYYDYPLLNFSIKPLHTYLIAPPASINDVNRFPTNSALSLHSLR